MTTDQWTIAGILTWTQGHFEKWRPETPRLDAELLLAFVLGCSRLDLYLKADQPLNEKERKVYRELIQQRADGCPIAYLISEKEFWSLSIEVNRNTLIPRPDTETLVENTVIQIQNWQKKHPESQCLIAELGTGTAAISLAMCAEMENLHIIAVDCSSDALEVAGRNLERHKSLQSPKKNRIELVESNLFSKISPTEKLNFIISNPPYIPSENISSLQVEIAQYEPHIALDGGPDGLSFYRYLLETAPSLLTPEGGMFLEIGFNQQANLNLLLKEYPDWKTSDFQLDLHGNYRVWELGLS